MTDDNNNNTNTNPDKPVDPFLVRFQPSDLRIASEFLTTWLSFLSRDLCNHCSTKLADRVRSLGSGTPLFGFRLFPWKI